MFEDFFSLPVFTGPPPHVFAVAVAFTFIQHRGANYPHNSAEDEETNGESGVVDGSLFGSPMPTLPVRIQNTDRHSQRDACNAEYSDLRPGLLLRGPSWQLSSGRQILGRIEDGESGRKH